MLRTCISKQSTLLIKDNTQFSFQVFLKTPHLSVKRICRELVGTLESVSVSLAHHHLVFVPTEYHCLVQSIQLGHRSLSFNSPHNHIRFPLPISKLTQSCCLFLIRVLVNHFRQPQSLDVILGERVQRLCFLQIVKGGSNFLPSKGDFKLDLDGIVIFVDVHKFQKMNRYRHVCRFIRPYWRNILVVAVLQN